MTMLARDTGEPLVVMGGYRVLEDGSLATQIAQPQPKSLPTSRDVALYEKYGMDGLEAMQYFGVIDRIKTGKEQGII